MLDFFIFNLVMNTEMKIPEYFKKKANLISEAERMVQTVYRQLIPGS